MYLQRIKDRVEEVGFPRGFAGLAVKIDMTPGNLHRCVRENKIAASDLEKIAVALGVPVSYFFDEETPAAPGRSPGRAASSQTSNDRIIALQEELIAVQKELIETKNALIEALSSTK